MIFVTVGTHEQPFDRLVRCIDKLKEDGTISEKVIIQSGYCTYKPEHCIWSKLFSYKEMESNIAKARIVITHGGPSSFIAPLQLGKTPIVVPRKQEFGEHINNHQVDFCKTVEKRMGNIIVVEDIEKLSNLIEHYDEILIGMRKEIISNNTKFCAEFEKVVDSIINTN